MGGCAKAAPSSTQSAPKADSKQRFAPIRACRLAPPAAHRRARRSGIACNSVDAEQRRRELVAVERIVERLRRLAPFKQQRAEADGPRRLLAEQPAGGALAAQRIVDDVADRRPVAAAPAKRCDRPQSFSASATGRWRRSMSSSTSMAAASRPPSRIRHSIKSSTSSPGLLLEPFTSGLNPASASHGRGRPNRGRRISPTSKCPSP